MVQLAARIAAAREGSGLSRHELAAQIGQSYWAVCKYEEGTRQPPSDVLARIAQATHTTTDYLLGRSDEPRPVRLTRGDDDELDRAIVSLRGKLSPEDRQEIAKFIEWVKERSRKKGPKS